MKLISGLCILFSLSFVTPMFSYGLVVPETTEVTSTSSSSEVAAPPVEKLSKKKWKKNKRKKSRIAKKLAKTSSKRAGLVFLILGSVFLAIAIFLLILMFATNFFLYLGPVALFALVFVIMGLLVFGIMGIIFTIIGGIAYGNAMANEPRKPRGGKEAPVEKPVEVEDEF